MTAVQRRIFQRNPAPWLNRAEAGEDIVIQSRGHAPITLRAGGQERRLRSRQADWDEHFRWLKSQPAVSDELFREVTRRDR